MSTEVCAVAAWGLRTTADAIRKTYTRTRTWVGAADGNRSFEFDPMTGRPNYEEREVKPPELEKWSVVDPCRRVTPHHDDTCVIALKQKETGAHNGSREPIERAPRLSDERREEFVADMKKIGLWVPADFDLWFGLQIYA